MAARGSITERQYIQQLRRIARDCDTGLAAGERGSPAYVKTFRRWQATLLGLPPRVLADLCELWLEVDDKPKEKHDDQETTPVQIALPPESGA